MFADLDKDGHDDLIVGSNSAVSVFFGLPDGALSAAAKRLDLPLPDDWWASSQVVLGDIDGDGYAEVLAVGSHLPEIRVFHNRCGSWAAR